MTSLSRRTVLGSSISLAGLAATQKASASVSAEDSSAKPVSQGAGKEQSKAPFESMRDYIAALDERGLVIRIPEADQDEYECAALLYRMRDQHGMRGGPVLIFEKVKIDGQWIEGPLIVNESGNADAECIAFGLDPVSEAPISKPPYKSYLKARDHVEKLIEDNGGQFPILEPQKVDPKVAPCKENVLLGDDIDLTKFAFIKNSPGDAGRYINTPMAFTLHPDYGPNYGTYRCHLRGPREIAVNIEPGQSGYRNIQAIKERGDKIARMSLALTADPYSWMLTGAKIGTMATTTDELAIAGGLAGRPTKIVKSETNDIWVPANSEMIIEGEIPLDDLRDEGPYSEWYGYQGPLKKDVFWMRVTAVTHRNNPWIMNNFTGPQVGTLKAAGHAASVYRLRQKFPHLVDWTYDTRASGIVVVSINKTEPGQGKEIVNHIVKRNFLVKTAIVVDADVDVRNHEKVLQVVVARMQPYNNVTLYESLPILPLDDSAPGNGRGSKMAIDATWQLPGEGRTKPIPRMNRAILEEDAPNAIARADEKWGDLIREWKQPV